MSTKREENYIELYEFGDKLTLVFNQILKNPALVALFQIYSFTNSQSIYPTVLVLIRPSKRISNKT